MANSSSSLSQVGDGSSRKWAFQSVRSFLLAMLIAFFPKCPFCWAAYMSFFGWLGLGRIPYQPWLLPVMMVLLAINIFFLLKNASQRRGYGPFFLNIAGIATLAVFKFGPEREWGLYVGIAMIFAGSVWNSWPKRRSTIAPVESDTSNGSFSCSCSSNTLPES